MRRITQLPALVIAAGALAALAACSPDKVVTTEDVPTAGVRFINAVPDTGGSDATVQITTWVKQHYTATTVGGTAVYDLTAPTS